MEPVYRQTLHQKVYENLKDMILNGTLVPGTKLNEATVAKEMNTSTTPVREAFRMLQSDGFVKMEPWKGVIVQEYNRDEIVETFKCREALECLGMELTIERIRNCTNPKAAVRRLEYEILMTEKAFEEGDYIVSSTKVHSIWIEGSGNSRLQGLLQGLNDISFYNKNLFRKNEDRIGAILTEHINILKAMCELDTQKATEALKEHIRNGMAFSLSSLDENLKRGLENGEK